MQGAIPETQFDLVVYGGTEAGIFAAIRAARCGLQTALVSPTAYLFGFFPSLGAWETHYPGCRAPLSTEMRQRIIDHYEQVYGPDSQELKDCLSLEPNNPMVTFEPHVAEAVLEAALQAESNVHILARHSLLEVGYDDGRILFVGTKDETGRQRRLAAPFYIDASYCGELAAMTPAPFRIGREDRSEFDEPHAGQIFTRWRPGRFPQASVEGRLNLLPTWSTTDPLPGSSGRGDDSVQDYSYRICLTCDPQNQRPVSQPDSYDRDRYAPLLLDPAEKAKIELPFQHRWLTKSLTEMVQDDHIIHGHALPRQKRSWNATNLSGHGKLYAKSNADQRQKIEKAHMDHALGLLYFLQTDPEVPAPVQREARKWALARDEFLATSNLPPCLYVREARRFVGSYIYREQDCLAHPGLERAPIHRDGIAFTEFALDSLACTTQRLDGSLPDGQFFEKDKSLPGSLPWRCLMPHGVSNLLTPTAPSVTHCAWGTVRQAACLLQLAETAALATALAHRHGIHEFPRLRSLDLQLHLVENGMMIGFFNDFDMARPEPWMNGALVFGQHGFFADYDARPNEPLSKAVAKLWIHAAQSLVDGTRGIAPNELAKRVRQAEAAPEADQAASAQDFLSLINESLPLGSQALTHAGPERAPTKRKQALAALYATLTHSRSLAPQNAHR